MRQGKEVVRTVARAVAGWSTTPSVADSLCIRRKTDTSGATSDPHPRAPTTRPSPASRCSRRWAVSFSTLSRSDPEEPDKRRRKRISAALSPADKATLSSNVVVPVPAAPACLWADRGVGQARSTRGWGERPNRRVWLGKFCPSPPPLRDAIRGASAMVDSSGRRAVRAASPPAARPTRPPPRRRDAARWGEPPAGCATATAALPPPAASGRNHERRRP